MSGDLYVAASGAIARLHELDVVANNLANANTIGFKADGALFSAALESALGDASGRPTPGAAGRAFVSARGLAPDASAGSVQATGSPLDVAIQGDGFFSVETPSGTRFTRAGSFVVDAEGRLTTPQGFPVLGSGGVLSVGSRPVEIRASGELVDDQGSPLGSLALVRFADLGQLAKDGQNLWRALPGVEPEDVDAPQLLERSVEASNVVPVRELARLVVLQRAFDTAMQVLQAQDQSTGSLLREIRS